MTIVENHLLTVTGGIDTHLDFHVAAAIDSNGGVLGVETFDTTTGGYRRLVAWLAGFGSVSLVGVEGTGSYGAGLTRHLTDKGIRVVEVDRPNRQARHRAGKTDAVDAISAARAALTGTATGLPKSRTGNIEAIRVLTIAQRNSAPQRGFAVASASSSLSTSVDGVSRRRRTTTTTEMMAAANTTNRAMIHPATPVDDSPGESVEAASCGASSSAGGP
jgi:transposase